jgi:hypothetical protein
VPSHGAGPVDREVVEPRDLPAELPVSVIEAGTLLYRIHRRELDPLWFGPAPGSPPRNRFDDPGPGAGPLEAPGRDASFAERGYRICYFGRSPEAAFAETFLRRPPVRLVSRAFVDTRGIAAFALSRALRVARLHGPALAVLGATAAVSSGPHDVARAWARALWAHPSAPDGLEYRCHHDDAELAVALYDRAADAVEGIWHGGLRDDRRWFGSVLDRYRLALDD